MDSVPGRFSQPFTVDEWGVQPSRLKLVRPDGLEIALAQRAMSVLVELARADGEVVRKYDLMNAVWGLAEVGDGALSQAIFELREAFGDDPKHPRIIETIRGVGFRLIPAVAAATAAVEAAVPAVPRPHSRALTFGSLGLVALLAAVAVWSIFRDEAPTGTTVGASLAVLPLANPDPAPVDDDLVNRLHEDLRAQVARIPGIRTISTESSRRYRGAWIEDAQVARELGVTLLLKGQIRSAGPEIRVDMELVEASAGRKLWAGQYTREPGASGILALNSDVTRAVARVLNASWSDPELDRALRPPSQNIQALEEWFKAGLGLENPDPERIRQAQAHLERAIELDPDFALAYAALARLYEWQIWFQNLPEVEQQGKMKPLIQRALELDAQLPLAHLLIARSETDPAEAIARFQEAIDLAPNSSDAYGSLANYQLWRLGDAAAAVRNFAIAAEIDPLNAELKCNLATALGAEGRSEEARSLLQSVLQGNENYPLGHLTMGILLRDGFGRGDEGIRHLQRAFELEPFEPHVARYLGDSYDGLGDPAGAAAWYERALALSGEGSGVTELLQGLLARSREDEAAALVAFERVSSPPSWTRQVATRYLAVADIRDGRPEEAWLRYAGAFPELLGRDPPLSPLNLEPAVMLVWLAAATGRSGEVRALTQRIFALFHSMPRMGWLGSGSGPYPILMRLAMGERAAAVAEFNALVEAGEYRERLDSVLFRDIADDPEYRRLSDVMAAARMAQRQRLAQDERQDVPLGQVRY